MIDFPIYLGPASSAVYAINDPEDFKRWYPRIFHPEYKAELLRLKPDDFTCMDGGIYIGDLKLWLHPGPGERVVIGQINY